MIDKSCIIEFGNIEQFKLFLLEMGKNTDYTWPNGDKPIEEDSVEYYNFFRRGWTGKENPFCVRVVEKKKWLKIGSLNTYRGPEYDLEIIPFKILMGSFIRRF